MEVDEPIDARSAPAGEAGATSSASGQLSQRPTPGLAAVQEEPSSASERHSSGSLTPSQPAASSGHSVMRTPSAQEEEAAHALVAAQSAGQAAGPSSAQSIADPANQQKEQPICANCHTQNTPLWRRSHDSTQILCNACALFYKMKGRPRPISLKTDIIKSRNRSKGKSASKDRQASAPATKNQRAASTSRLHSDASSRGPDSEEDTPTESHKSKPASSAYGAHPGAYPYPYPFPYAHPHQHQPYPMPPRERSRSSSTTRRTQSIEGRSPWSALRPGKTDSPPTAGVAPYPYGYPPAVPPPAGEFPYPYYYVPPGFPPGQPFLPPGYPLPGHLHSSAFSDSRSASSSRNASASPPPSMAAKSGSAPHQLPPLASSLSSTKSDTAASTSGPRPGRADPGFTLPPLQPDSKAPNPRSDGQSLHLPSIASVAPNASSRDRPLFQSNGSAGTATTSDPAAHLTTHQPERSSREASVMSSVSGASHSAASSEGHRSPPQTHSELAWDQHHHDVERRGRSERRFEDGLAHEAAQTVQSNGMVGVETYMNDLRVRDPSTHPTLDGSGSSRSRSSGHEERGRSRGRYGVRSGSLYRGANSAQGATTTNATTVASPSQDRSTSSSSSRMTNSALAASEAEVAKLKTKVAELTFLNSLMQSRLMQLEGPDRVPSAPISSIMSNGEGQDQEMQDESLDEQERLEVEELKSHGVVTAKDAQTRKTLLAFFRSQSQSQSQSKDETRPLES